MIKKIYKRYLMNNILPLVSSGESIAVEFKEPKSNTQELKSKIISGSIK